MTAVRGQAPPAGAAGPLPRLRREYLLGLALGAVGAGAVLLSARQGWARVATPAPAPLPASVVSVSGQDLVPLAGALALAALACLAAVIATRGAVRRAAGVLLALFGAGAGAAVTTSVTAASVLSVAAGKVGSPGAAAVSGAVGSTTGGGSGGGSLVVGAGPGHAVLTGAPWQAVVLAGALLVFLAGLATALRGPRWPVMSARYDAPGQAAGDSAANHGAANHGAANHGPANHGPGEQTAGRRHRARPRDAASMWESLSGGADPTDYDLDEGDAASESIPATPREGKP